MYIFQLFLCKTVGIRLSVCYYIIEAVFHQATLHYLKVPFQILLLLFVCKQTNNSFITITISITNSD